MSNPTKPEASIEDASDVTLTRAELALRWKCSAQTVQRREQDVSIPRMKFGPRIVRYRLSDVLEYESRSASHVAQSSNTKSCQTPQ